MAQIPTWKWCVWANYDTAAVICDRTVKMRVRRSMARGRDAPVGGNSKRPLGKIIDVLVQATFEDVGTDPSLFFDGLEGFVCFLLGTQQRRRRERCPLFPFSPAQHRQVGLSRSSFVVSDRDLEIPAEAV